VTLPATRAVTYRPGTADDARAVFDVFFAAAQDLARRHGLGNHYEIDSPAELEKLWNDRRPLFEHMARHAESFWIAEEDGRAIGYARAFLRDGLRELTEFFVRPEAQARGVGKGLLDRVFPTAGASRRVILATVDGRALTRYLRTRLRPRFVIFLWSRKAEPREIVTDLALEPLPQALDAGALDALALIDRELLEIRRDADHAYLAAHKQGFVARRAGRVVAYGYAGARSGPFAALDPADQPALYAHAETLVAPSGGDFGISLPMVNLAAIDYVLQHGFKLDPFTAHFLSDVPFGRFDRYAFTTPSFFL
jgi:GNAT superfamily N-acetyltransferase